MSSSSGGATVTPLSCAIVGCGQIVTHHVQAMAAISSSSYQQQPPQQRRQQQQAQMFQVRALVDVNPQRRTVIQNLPAVQEMNKKNNMDDDSSSMMIAEYDTLDDLLATMNTNTTAKHSIDIIFIAVPHDLHESLTMRALQGTPASTMVVLEKPVAVTYESCQRLVQASGPSSPYFGRLFIAEQSPYWPAVQKAQEMIQHDGSIGTLLSASSFYYESMRDNVTSGSTQGSALGWRGSLARAGGGICLDGGLHWLRPLREICGGRVTAVIGTMRHHVEPSLEMQGEGLAHALLEMETPSSNSSSSSNSNTSPYIHQPAHSGKLVATFSCHLASTAVMAHGHAPYFRFTGTKGELVILGNGLDAHTPGAGNLIWYHDDAKTGTPVLPTDQTGGFFRGFQGLWRHIHATYISKNKAAAHESVLRAAEDVQAVLALYQSVKSRTWEATATMR